MTKVYVHREPLTSDIIFKATFGQDIPECKAALIEALNLVLERKDDPIVDLTYLNPFSIAEAEKEKVIIMDIKIETSKGELIDVEMQMNHLEDYVNRTVFYGCKQLTKGLESGEDYGKMKKSIVISFIATTLFPKNVPMHSTFTLHEDTVGNQLSNILELHYIELGKINLKNADVDSLSPIEQFGAYLKYSGNESKAEFVETLVQRGEKVISMADTVLRKISEEERMQALREDRETAELFLRMEKTAALERGHAEGHAEGLAEGKREQALESARILKAEGASDELIMKSTHLSIEEIKAL